MMLIFNKCNKICLDKLNININKVDIITYNSDNPKISK